MMKYLVILFLLASVKGMSQPSAWTLLQNNKNRYLLLFIKNVEAAFSLYQLHPSATNCIRVRRSSDNSEQNFGFVNGYLDTTSLKSFVGANDGFVTTWYNQTLDTARLYNYVQPSASRQPIIVSAGVVQSELGFNASRGFTNTMVSGSERISNKANVSILHRSVSNINTASDVSVGGIWNFGNIGDVAGTFTQNAGIVLGGTTALLSGEATAVFAERNVISDYPGRVGATTANYSLTANSVYNEVWNLTGTTWNMYLNGTQRTFSLTSANFAARNVSPSAVGANSDITRVGCASSNNSLFFTYNGGIRTILIRYVSTSQEAVTALQNFTRW